MSPGGRCGREARRLTGVSRSPGGAAIPSSPRRRGAFGIRTDHRSCCVSRSAGSGPVLAVALYQHAGPDGHALIEVGDILVEHPHAARRHLLADAPGLVGAVNSEQDVAVTLIEVEGAGAEWIVDAALASPRQVRVERDHGGRRAPIRPNALPADPGLTLPGKAGLADADAVLHRGSVGLHQQQLALVDVDQDGAGLLGAVV